MITLWNFCLIHLLECSFEKMKEGHAEREPYLANAAVNLIVCSQCLTDPRAVFALLGHKAVPQNVEHLLCRRLLEHVRFNAAKDEDVVKDFLSDGADFGQHKLLDTARHFLRNPSNPRFSIKFAVTFLLEMLAWKFYPDGTFRASFSKTLEKAMGPLKNVEPDEERFIDHVNVSLIKWMARATLER